MRLFRRPKTSCRSIAVFCGAFHPPTVAHVSLAEAALRRVDEVMWVMPEAFPHKRYEGVPLPGRLRLVLEATQHAVGVSRGNLFFDVAAEVAGQFNGAQVHLLMGEDGARRLMEWDYGLDRESTARYLRENLERYPLLCARRGDEWEAPEELARHIEWLDHHEPEVSATLVRQRIAENQDWEGLVPEPIRGRVAALYGSAGQAKGQ
jgi:nicotinate-nucleotide adenylyltransferase